MRDQYAGDISDFVKYALLRQLVNVGENRLGVAWYYDPGNDGRSDGRHLEWQDDDNWAAIDLTLHRSLTALPERSIAAIEEIDFWPAGTIFYRKPIPSRLVQRQEWFEDLKATLEPASLVFLDPDIGLGKPSRKHATLEELSELRKAGRALSFITFPAHTSSHPCQLEHLHTSLDHRMPACHPVTLTTCVSLPNPNNPNRFHPRIRWFTVVDGDPELHKRLQRFAELLGTIPYVKVAVHP